MEKLYSSKTCFKIVGGGMHPPYPGGIPPPPPPGAPLPVQLFSQRQVGRV